MNKPPKLYCLECGRETKHLVPKAVKPARDIPAVKSAKVRIGKELVKGGITVWQRPYLCQEDSCKDGINYAYMYLVEATPIDNLIEKSVRLLEENKSLRLQLAELKSKLQNLANEIPSA